MQTKLNYSELLKVIIWEIGLMKKLFGNNAKYSELINRLRNFNDESVDPYPKQKELLTEFGLKRIELITLMRDLVAEFYEVARFDYPILDTEVVLNVDGLDGEFFTITLKNIGHIPRLKETISLPFCRTGYGSLMHLVVTDIDHNIENQRHTINISASHKLLDARKTLFNDH